MSEQRREVFRPENAEMGAVAIEGPAILHRQAASVGAEYRIQADNGCAIRFRNGAKH